MKKGTFGIVLCFYPIAAFVGVILNSPLVCAILAAIAIFIEKDEWAGRQTLQAWMASVAVYFFGDVVRWGVTLFRIPVLSNLLSVLTTVLFVVVYLASIIFSILAIMRVSQGGEANFPILSSLAYRAYGKVRPKPVAPPVQQPMPGQPYAPYGAPVQPGAPVDPNAYPQQAAMPQQPPYQPQPEANPYGQQAPQQQPTYDAYNAYNPYAQPVAAPPQAEAQPAPQQTETPAGPQNY